MGNYAYKSYNEKWGYSGTLFSVFLDTNGDGTGTKNAIGDYSSAEEIFYSQPTSPKVVRLTRLIVCVEDDSPFRMDHYGKNIGLTNGIVVRVKSDSGVTMNLTDDDFKIKTNAGWAQYCYDAEIFNVGSGNDFLKVRWDFLQMGYPIKVGGSENYRLEVVLNDDFTGLAGHTFLAQGYYEKKA